MPLSVFCDNDSSNFRPSNLFRKYKILRWKIPSSDVDATNKEIAAYAKTLSNRSASKLLSCGDYSGDYDPTCGLTVDDISVLTIGIRLGCVKVVFLDFDRTLSLCEGVPAKDDSCYPSVKKLLHAETNLSTNDICELYFGGAPRIAALQTLWRVAKNHKTRIIVVTNNDCEELIADLLLRIGCKSRVVSARKRGLPKIDVMIKILGSPARVSEKDKIYGKFLHEYAKIRDKNQPPFGRLKGN